MISEIYRNRYYEREQELKGIKVAVTELYGDWSPQSRMLAIRDGLVSHVDMHAMDMYGLI